jgi:DNA primase
LLAGEKLHRRDAAGAYQGVDNWCGESYSNTVRNVLTRQGIGVECRAERRGSLPDTFVDFKIIKERVSIGDVLGHYNIRLRRVNQHSLRGRCPLPMHSSEQSTESFIADEVKNVWACQSRSCVEARDGKKGGNVLDFASIMERCSIRDAAIKLHGWFSSASSAAVGNENRKGSAVTEKLASKKESDASETEINKPLSFTLKDIDHVHAYMTSRGIDEATAKYFGAGYFPGRGSMSGRVVIPIHNERGDLVAYAGRSIDATERKYKLPAGFKKSDVVFNFNRIIGIDETVIVVEGFFDCMKVHQAGFPNVVALMGSSLSDAQENLLQQFEDVILFFDGDPAGREGAHAIGVRLMYRSFVRAITVPDGKQPDQLSADEINSRLGSFFE